jgi:MYXO-CTERM domain-containing protein
VDPVTGVFTWTPSYRDGGSWDVVVSVTDGATATEQPFTLTVDVPDGDGDGLPDTWEQEHGTDPATPDADADPDGDGYPNRQEYDLGSDPLDPDDPGTVLPDGGVDSGDATPGGEQGCACRAPTGPDGAPLALLLLLALLTRLRRRDPRRHG